MFEQGPIQESLPSAEASAEKIRRDFREKPSSEVELLANNLARPDGFAKSLIIGKLLTSRALADAIAPEFVRTNRGYYKAYPRVLHDSHDKNEYISFKVGKTQLMYAVLPGSRHKMTKLGKADWAMLFRPSDCLKTSGRG